MSIILEEGVGGVGGNGWQLCLVVVFDIGDVALQAVST